VIMRLRRLVGGRDSFFGNRATGGFVLVEGEASQFSLNIQSQQGATLSATPGPVTPPNMPTLRILRVGDLPVPAAPGGNLKIPDVSFPTPLSGQVPVALTASISQLPSR